MTHILPKYYDKNLTKSCSMDTCLGKVRNTQEIIRRAAADTGFRIFTTVDQRGLVNVFTGEPHRDHGPFWKRVDELEAEYLDTPEN